MTNRYQLSMLLKLALSLLILSLLAACSDEKPPKQAINEMIESPLQNTVISSFYAYPPRPVAGGGVEPAEAVKAASRKEAADTTMAKFK